MVRALRELRIDGPSGVESEFADCGLRVVEILGDVAGKEYDPEANEFAIVARYDAGK
jgi:hypothetical protein